MAVRAWLGRPGKSGAQLIRKRKAQRVSIMTCHASGMSQSSLQRKAAAALTLLRLGWPASAARSRRPELPRTAAGPSLRVIAMQATPWKFEKTPQKVQPPNPPAVRLCNLGG